MQIDIILEPDLTPEQVTELAVAAENYGFRTLWHSNYHQNPDAFMMLVPAAMATRRIRLGVLAISPYEIQPLKRRRRRRRGCSRAPRARRCSNSPGASPTARK